MLTDQEHYNLGIPQLGPGKDPTTGLDPGRFAQTGDSEDVFRFRTPPLRNVAATGPWMHNGAFGNLSDAVRHHLNAKKSLSKYDPSEQCVQNEHDFEELAGSVITDPDLILQGLDIKKTHLKESEIDDLLEFLASLTAPNLETRLFATIPASVPSGLDVEPFTPSAP